MWFPTFCFLRYRLLKNFCSRMCNEVSDWRLCIASKFFTHFSWWRITIIESNFKSNHEVNTQLCSKNYTYHIHDHSCWMRKISFQKDRDDCSRWFPVQFESEKFLNVFSFGIQCYSYQSIVIVLFFHCFC